MKSQWMKPLRVLMTFPLLIVLSCSLDSGLGGNGNGSGSGGGGGFTVSYAGNGHTHGAVPGPSVPDQHGAFLVADPGDFRGPDIRDGIKRRFVRWNDAADGSGNQYEAGTWHTPLTNHDLTLYAQWWEDGDSVLRQTGVAGGLVFYDKGAYSDGWRYLELSPLSTEWSSIVFGGHAVEIAGTSEEIGTGLANTQIIVAALVGVGETGKAAQLCNDLVYNGYSDWFLPTVLELQAIAPPLGTGPASLSRLTRTSYWASHTHGVPPLTFASVFSFNQAAYGHLHSGRETNTARVRAVRRF